MAGEIHHNVLHGPDINLAIVSDRFRGTDYPATVEALYALLWQVARPVLPIRLHVFDLDEFEGWRCEMCGQVFEVFTGDRRIKFRIGV